MNMFKGRKKNEFEVDDQQETIIEEVEIEEDDEEVEEVAILEPESGPKEESILTADMIVNGDITCDCNLTIWGKVIGKVECRGRLRIKGNITGNVKANEVDINSSEVNGDIECSGVVTMNNQASVTGNIHSQSCQIDGVVKGNVTCDDSLHVQKNARICGDVKTRQISVLPGAQLESKVQMLTEAEVNA